MLENCKAFKSGKKFRSLWEKVRFLQVLVGKSSQYIRVLPQSGNIVSSIRVEGMDKNHANGGHVRKKAQANLLSIG